MLLYIKNLPPDASKNHIRALFAGINIGADDILLPGGQSAYVKFQDTSDLLEVYANSEMEDPEILGQAVTFRLCREEEMQAELQRFTSKWTSSAPPNAASRNLVFNEKNLDRRSVSESRSPHIVTGHKELPSVPVIDDFHYSDRIPLDRGSRVSRESKDSKETTRYLDGYLYGPGSTHDQVKHRQVSNLGSFKRSNASPPKLDYYQLITGGKVMNYETGPTKSGRSTSSSYIERTQNSLDNFYQDYTMKQLGSEFADTPEVSVRDPDRNILVYADSDDDSSKSGTYSDRHKRGDGSSHSRSRQAEDRKRHRSPSKERYRDRPRDRERRNRSKSPVRNRSSRPHSPIGRSRSSMANDISRYRDRSKRRNLSRERQRSRSKDRYSQRQSKEKSDSRTQKPSNKSKPSNEDSNIKRTDDNRTKKEGEFNMTDIPGSGKVLNEAARTDTEHTKSANHEKSCPAKVEECSTKDGKGSIGLHWLKEKEDINPERSYSRDIPTGSLQGYVPSPGHLDGPLPATNPLEGHYVFLKSLPSWATIESIHELFNDCNVVKQSSKMVSNRGVALYAYLEVASQSDIYKACVTPVGDTTLSVMPLTATIYQRELAELVNLNRKAGSSEFLVETIYTNKMKPFQGPNEGYGPPPQHSTPLYHFPPPQLPHLNPFPAMLYPPPPFYNNFPVQPPPAYPDPYIQPMAQIPRQPVYQRLETVEEHFEFVGFMSGDEKHCKDVCQYLNIQLKSMEIVKPPVIARTSHTKGSYTVKLCVSINADTPALPKFVVLGREFCYVHHPRQASCCPVCRGPADHPLAIGNCVGLAHDKDIAIHIEESHFLSPIYSKEIVYQGRSYPSIMAVIEGFMAADLGESVIQRPTPARQTWLLNKFNLLIELYDIQISGSAESASFLRNSVTGKPLVYLGLDPILGMGMQHLSDPVLAPYIKSQYMDGENMIGQVLAVHRDKLSLLDREQKVDARISDPVDAQISDPPVSGPVEHIIFDGFPDTELPRAVLVDQVEKWLGIMLPGTKIYSIRVSGTQVDYEQTVYLTLTAAVAGPIFPSLSAFSIISNLACTINHPSQNLCCEVCRQPHDERDRCIGQSNTDLRSSYIFIDPLHPLRPQSHYLFNFRGTEYKCFMDAVQALQKLDIGRGVELNDRHKVFTWEANHFDQMEDLFRAQVMQNARLRKFISDDLGMCGKPVIYLSGDPVLGSGSFSEHDMTSVKCEYHPGMNLYGKIVGKIQVELLK